MKISYVSLAIIFLLNVSPLFAQENGASVQLSFEQAWQMTSQNSHVVKQVSYLQKEKEQADKASKALYLPKIGVTASYMLMSDDLSLDLTKVRDAITPLYGALANYGNFSGVINPNTGQVLPDNLSTQTVRSNLRDGLAAVQNGNWDPTIQKKQFGVVAATFQWPLFVGGKIGVANHVSKIEKQEVQEVLFQKQGELMSELAERYFGLCLANQAIQVREEVYAGMQKHLKDAEKMQAQGLIANADVLHARVYNAQSERELDKARRTAGVLNQALNNTLALENDTLIKPTTALFYLDSIEPAAYFRSLALTKNPLLLQVESNQQLTKEGIKAERADYFPAVALQGMYNVANKDLSPYTPDWLVGVGVKWTLFDGASRYRKVKEASFKRDQVEEIHLKAQSDIVTMIDKLYNELRMYEEQLKELESAQKFAEEYLRMRQKAFTEEMSNATEVVDASLALAGVRIERLQAMYGYDLTLAKLLQYAGIPEQFPSYQQRNTVKTERYLSEK